MSGDTGRVHMTKDELYKTCDELCCVRATLIDERSELRNKLFAEQADNARLRAERDELKKILTWIPVSERLPTTEESCHDMVLRIKMKTKDIAINVCGFYDYEEEEFQHRKDGEHMWDVVGWYILPLPLNLLPLPPLPEVKTRC